VIAEHALSPNFAGLLSAADGSLLASVVAAISPVGTRGTVAFDAASHALTFRASGLDALVPEDRAMGSFGFTIAPEGGSNSATVLIGVSGVNTAPDAADASAETSAVTPVTVDGLANETDPDFSDAGALTILRLGPLRLGGVPVEATATAGPGGLGIGATGALPYARSPTGPNLGPGETATEGYANTIADASGRSDTATNEIL